MKAIKKSLLFSSVVAIVAGCSSTKEEILTDPMPDKVGLSATEQRIMGLGDCIELTTASTKWTLEEVSITTLDRDESHTIATVTKRPMLKADAPFEYTLDSLKIAYADKGVTLTFGELPDLSGQVRYYRLNLTKGTDRQTFTGRQELMDGESRDCIKLSSDNVTFTAAGGTANLTTMESPWWFSNISYPDGRYDYPQNSSEQLPWSYTSESGWLSIERTDLSHFTITALPNTSGNARSCVINLMLGNLYNSLTVCQEAN